MFMYYNNLSILWPIIQFFMFMSEAEETINIYVECDKHWLKKLK